MADHVVVNASPLIVLSRAGALDLLGVAGPVQCVPEAVRAEICARGLDDVTARAVTASPTIRVVPDAPIPASESRWDLGKGETAVIAWAIENAPSVAILDDMEGRRCARSPGIQTFGTVGMVIRAKRQSVIPAVRPTLEKLVSVGMYLTEEVFAEVLRLVGE